MLVAFFILTQISLADSLYAHHYYNPAQVEYKREFFFNPYLKKDQHKRLRFAIALMENDKSKGITEFKTIIVDFPDLKPEIKIEMAKRYLNLGNYYQARELLAQTDAKNLLGLTYLLNDELSKAHNLFISLGNYEISNDINAYVNQSKKSMKTATFLSLICPGAGEIYAGNISLGIKDFLLNVGSGYLFYNALKKKKYVDAVLVFNFLIQRFYLGSIANARESVLEANRRQRQIWLKHMHNQYFPNIDLTIDKL